MNSSEPDYLNGWVLDDPPTVFPFQFEQVDIQYWNIFIECNWQWAYYIAGFYVIVVLFLRRYMKSRKPFNLQFPLFLWNFGLAVFSIVALARVAPPFYRVLMEDNGFYNIICVRKGLNHSNVLWGVLFLVSKVIELGDTIFLLLRKRPLLFIHWYHHVTTLLVTWTVAPFSEPIGRVYSSLNFFVHSFMYPYFAAKSIGINVPTTLSRFITLLQFMQMLIGLFANFGSIYYTGTDSECVRYKPSIILFSVVYGSFTLLFGKLLYKSYFKPKQN